jgi:protein-S-isoprenylcysteine O-methyltransferase Ste14
MAIKINSSVGKVLYASLFTLVLPFLLILWAVKMESNLSLPVYENPILGIIVIIGGMLIMSFGIIELISRGKGLPMNPYPPDRFVTSGIYKYITHPIYTGASLLIIGVSIFFESASGLWIISPLFIVGCFALVVGFERKDLLKRFPDKRFKTLISIPKSYSEEPTVWDKISAYVLVLVPWIILSQAFSILGISIKSKVSYFPFEAHIPVINFTIIFYLIAYPMILLTPIIAKTKRDLRDFMVTGLIAMLAGFYFMFIFMFFTPVKISALPTIWGAFYEFAKISTDSFTAFPSFHVIWILLALAVYVKRFPSLKILWQFTIIVILISCLTTGIYSLLDVLGGIFVFLLAYFRYSIWKVIKKFAENIANSWKEWNFGYIRMMNHGLYGGLATFIGLTIIGLLIGKEHLPAILLVAVTVMISSALWAQFIEGSKKLLRPLGFYGGVIGGILGCILVNILFGVNFFLIFAALTVASPWVQAIGRVRCLVQGCCHGHITKSNIGIRYFHDRSRVVGLSDLKGEYLHPTPVYSILANTFYGIILFKLWFTTTPLSLIIGLSFIFNGLARFVEESYRGEPQTPIIGGLRVYQWIALIGIIVGAIFTTISVNVVRFGIHLNMDVFVFAFVAGLLSTILTGVDFPKANKRFSRLV